MLFVLFGHVVELNMGLPIPNDIKNDFMPIFGRLLVGNFAVGGVDIFILISGWFSIHATIKGLLKFLFQFLFLGLIILLLFIIIDKNNLNFNNIKTLLGIYEGYWFVMAYLGLYIFSPLLNLFSQNVTKKQFQYFLIAFYIFQCYYSWMTSYVNYFNGYSIILFIGLYLTARYFRLYPTEWIHKYAGLLYISLVFLSSLLLIGSLYFLENAGRMVRYDNPIVIFSSICLVIFFWRYNFHNKLINWMAASSFAVYIIHFNPLVFKYIKDYSLILIEHYNGIIYMMTVLAFIIAIYVICTIIDQIRLFFWKLLLKIKDHHFQNLHHNTL